MNYKKGDKVIIKSREWYNKNKDEYGIITFSTDRGGYNFTKQDVCFCGRVVTIKYEGYVFKDENGNVINTAKITIEKKKEECSNT